jgi:hypothetical protein
LSGRGAIGFSRICGSIPNSVLCSPGALADSHGWKWINYRAKQAGGRERFCVCLFWRSRSSQMLAAALSVVLCIALLLARLQIH